MVLRPAGKSCQQVVGETATIGRSAYGETSLGSSSSTSPVATKGAQMRFRCEICLVVSLIVGCSHKTPAPTPVSTPTTDQAPIVEERPSETTADESTAETSAADDPPPSHHWWRAFGPEIDIELTAEEKKLAAERPELMRPELIRERWLQEAAKQTVIRVFLRLSPDHTMIEETYIEMTPPHLYLPPWKRLDPSRSSQWPNMSYFHSSMSAPIGADGTFEVRQFIVARGWIDRRRQELLDDRERVGSVDHYLVGTIRSNNASGGLVLVNGRSRPTAIAWKGQPWQATDDVVEKRVNQMREHLKGRP